MESAKADGESNQEREVGEVCEKLEAVEALAIVSDEKILEIKDSELKSKLPNLEGDKAANLAGSLGSIGSFGQSSGQSTQGLDDAVDADAQWLRDQELEVEDLSKPSAYDDSTEGVESFEEDEADNAGNTSGELGEISEISLQDSVDADTSGPTQHSPLLQLISREKSAKDPKDDAKRPTGGSLTTGAEAQNSKEEETAKWEVKEYLGDAGAAADWEVQNDTVREVSRSPSPDIGNISIEEDMSRPPSGRVSLQSSPPGTSIRTSPARYLAQGFQERKPASKTRQDTQLPQVTWPKRADEEYEYLETCGAGSFGEVYKACCRKDGRIVAVKVMESDKWALEEAAILREMDHECICKLYDCLECADEGMTCLVMQYASGGDLLERVIKTGALTEKAAADIAKQLLGALKYMHSKGVVHRDLKPENVLYSKESEGKPLLADFGVGKRLDVDDDKDTELHLPPNRSTAALRTHSRQIGTVGYSAPEVNTDQGHSFAADVWSFGAMIYVLLCGYHPFDKGDDPDDVIQARVWKGEVLSMEGYGWESISAEAKDFVRRCLVVDVNERATIDQCLDHAWLRMDFMDVVELVGAFARLKVYHGSRRESRSITAKETATRLKRKRETSVASDDGSTGSLTPTPSKNKKQINREFTPSTSTVSEAEGDESVHIHSTTTSTKRERKRAVSSAAAEINDRPTSHLESPDTFTTASGKREKRQEGIHSSVWHKNKGPGAGAVGRGVPASPARKRDPPSSANDASPGRSKRPQDRHRVAPSEFTATTQTVGGWQGWGASTSVPPSTSVLSPELGHGGQGVDLELLSLEPSSSGGQSERGQEQETKNSPTIQPIKPARSSQERENHGHKRQPSSDLLTVLEEETQQLGPSPARLRAGIEDLSITVSKPTPTKPLLSGPPPALQPIRQSEQNDFSAGKSNPLDSAGLESLSLGCAEGLGTGSEGVDLGLKEATHPCIIPTQPDSHIDETQKRKRERSADLDSPNDNS